LPLAHWNQARPPVLSLLKAVVVVEQLVMAGCSHLPMWEQPEAYRSAVEQWLSRHD